jgi:hypothetical protein
MTGEVITASVFFVDLIKMYGYTFIPTKIKKLAAKVNAIDPVQKR